jgi:hypothetical protein
MLKCNITVYDDIDKESNHVPGKKWILLLVHNKIQPLTKFICWVKQKTASEEPVSAVN